MKKQVNELNKQLIQLNNNIQQQQLVIKSQEKTIKKQEIIIAKQQIPNTSRLVNNKTNIYKSNEDDDMNHIVIVKDSKDNNTTIASKPEKITYTLTEFGEVYLSNKVIVADALALTTGEDVYSYELELPHANFTSFKSAIRPAYIWDNYNQSGIEIGYFRQKNKTKGKTYNEEGYKTTLYHSFKVGESILSSRPDIRFYVSHIETLHNEISKFDFNGKSHQLSFGSQTEVLFELLTYLMQSSDVLFYI